MVWPVGLLFIVVIGIHGEAVMADTQQKFKNRFLLMRHGQAESNVQGIHISDPERAIPSYGLTEAGKQQAEKASETLKDLLSEYTSEELTEKLVVISSDFRRARETAEIVHAQLSVKLPLHQDSRLRERGMGSLEGRPREEFRKILDNDMVDPTHSEDGVESLTSMVSRMGEVFRDADKEFEEKVVLVVSHGDPLSCIYAVYNNVSPCKRYKEFSMYKTCEIREMQYVGETLQQEREL